MALLLGALTLGEATGWPFLRVPLQSALTRAAGVPVQLEGNFSMRLLWRPQVQVQHFSVGSADGLELPHLIDAQAVALRWRWGDLLRWRDGAPLRVQRLVADELDAQLMRTRDGRASWHLGGAPRQRSALVTNEPDALPQFGTLKIARGVIRLDDEVLDSQIRIEMAANELRPAKTHAAAPQPRPAPSASNAGNVGYAATLTGRWHSLPLDLRVESDGVLPLFGDADGAPDDVALRVNGRTGAARISYDGRASALLGERRLRGALRLRGPSLAQVAQPLGVTLPQTPPFEIEGNIEHSSGVWKLVAEHATIGRSRLGGEFRFETGHSPHRLEGQLTGKLLALADLAPAVGATPDAAGTAAGADKNAGRVLPQRNFDLPSLSAMDASVEVAVDELDLGSPHIAALKQLRTNVTLQSGVLRLSDLQAVAAGGRFAGTTTLDARDKLAQWNVDVQFNGVDVAQWLHGLRPSKGADTAYLTGELSGRVKATGEGRSTAQILATLDGSGELRLRDGSLSHLVMEAAGLDLAQALGVALRGDDALPLRCARMNLKVENGVVHARQAVLDNADSTARITGTVDLRNEKLDLRVSVKPKDVSPLSLRSPIVVAGTLAHPEVGIDGKRLAGRVIAAAALAAIVAPLAALLPLLDTGSGPDGDPCASPPPATRDKPSAADAPAGAGTRTAR